MVNLRLSGGADNAIEIFSIGGAMSSSIITDDMLNNLFDKIIKLEVLNEKEEYRCIYVYNNGNTDIRNLIVKTKTIPPFTKVGLGIEGTAIAQIITNEGHPPSGVVFYNVDSYVYLKISLGVLSSGEGKPLWIRRSTSQGVNLGEFEITFDWDEIAYTSSEDFYDRGSFSENLKIKTLSNETLMGRFIIGEGIVR